MKPSPFFIKEQNNTKFTLKPVTGTIYPSSAIIEGVTYRVAPNVGKIPDYLFGSMLNMYISGDELLPVPKSNLKANYRLMPEIVNGKEEIKRIQNKSIEELENLLKKYQDPKRNKAGLDKLANEILTATDQFLNKSLTELSPLNTILDPISKEMLPVFAVRLTRHDAENAEVRHNITVSNGTETIKLTNQLVDTGAKIPLIMPQISKQLNLTPTKRVVLSGISEDLFATDAVPIRFGIDGHEYHSVAAIFPRLQAITNSDVLIDGSLFNKSINDGVDYRKKY